MTIDEAIKEIQNEVDEHPSCTDLAYYKALKLGIEALKAIERQRESMRAEYFTQLPGETE